MNQILRPLIPQSHGETVDCISYRLGMPHLNAQGVSENWLLKELGDRHWLLLAHMAGHGVPEFRDELGNPVYAAFCAISIEGAQLDLAQENDLLTVTSSVVRLSRTQIASRHVLAIGSRPLGTVEMISTFVRRMGDGNHSVARYAVGGLPVQTETGIGASLAANAAAHRNGRLKSYQGFDLEHETAIVRYSFAPVPSLDFNGAGFLYFASFQAFVDRAEWAFAMESGIQDQITRATTTNRTLFFTANLNPKEEIEIAVMAMPMTQRGTLSHHCRMYNKATRELIAEVFTVKAIKTAP